jgi:hypothetical protein
MGVAARRIYFFMHLHIPESIDKQIKKAWIFPLLWAFLFIGNCSVGEMTA